MEGAKCVLSLLARPPCLARHTPRSSAVRSFAPPAGSDGYQPITQYVLRTSDPDGVLATSTITLQVGSDDFAGPAAGYFVASLGGNPLLPGQAVSFDVAACNGGGYPAAVAPGCGNFVPVPALTLHTSNSTPGAVPTPMISGINSTHLTLGVEPASYTGGAPITRYDLKIFPLPAPTETIVDLGASAPRLYALEGRQSDLNYAFEVRAVNAEGSGS